MVVFLLFLAYLVACLALAALLVPALQPQVFGPLGLAPESSLYRFAMLAALAGFPLFLRRLQLNSWQAAGYTLARYAAWRSLGAGLLVGIAIMAALNGAQWVMETHHFAPRPDRWNLVHFLRTLSTGLLSGLAVALIEETLFRGLMHTGMRRRLGFWSTALLTAGLYASLHFVKPAAPGDLVFDTPNALRMIGAGIGRLNDFAPIADSFSTLLIAGIFLSMVRERSGNILWAIGIHAGWVMMIKMMKYLTNPTITAGQTSPWIGSYDNITGWLATLWLGSLALLYWNWPRTPGRGGIPG